MNDAEKVKALLEVIRDEVLPLIESEVARGNAPCGSAILRADTLTSVMVGADNRVTNPLFHGNIDAINRFFKLPVHPPAETLIFLVTHDPCPMCAAAIALAGFKELWVLKGYEDVEQDCSLKESHAMYRDIFGVDGIRHENNFFTRRSIRKLVATSTNREELQTLLDCVDHKFAALRKGLV